MRFKAGIKPLETIQRYLTKVDYNKDFLFALALFIFGFCFSAGIYIEFEPQASFYQKYFISAIQMYCGFGPTILDIGVAYSGDASNILRYDLSAVDCSSYSNATPMIGHYFGSWHDKHPLLSSLMALCWKLLGLDYINLWPIAGLFGGLTLLSIYLISNALGASAFITVLCVIFIFNWTDFAKYTIHLRDFSKTPFILLSVAMSLYAVNRSSEQNIRSSLTYFALGGFICGVGSGFREDAVVGLICIYAFVVIAAFKLKTRHINFLLLALFFPASIYFATLIATDFLNTVHTVEMNGMGHFVLVGFANAFREILQYTNDDFNVLYSFNDAAAHGTGDWYASKKIPYFIDLSGDFGKTASKLIWHYFSIIPLEFGLRALNSTRTVIETFWVFNLVGIWLLGFALLIMTKRYLHLASLTTLIILFSFIGSFQFDVRHLYHLLFLEAPFIALFATILAQKELKFDKNELVERSKILLKISFFIAILFIAVVSATAFVQSYQLKIVQNHLSKMHWKTFEINNKKYLIEQRDISEEKVLVRITYDHSKCNLEENIINLNLVINENYEMNEQFNVKKGQNQISKVYLSLYRPEIAPTTIILPQQNCISSIEYTEAPSGIIPTFRYIMIENLIAKSTPLNGIIQAFKAFFK